MVEESWINRLYNYENFENYAFFCCEMALDIISNQDRWDSIILPSRGAIPIFFGIISYLETIQHKNKDAERFLKRLNLCPFIKEYYNELKQKEFETKEGNINVLILPYTADINLKDKNRNIDEFVDLTREYWVNVTSTFYKNKKERLNNENFLMYLFLLSEVEGRKDLVKYYKKFPKIKNPILIDTVISGRAISTIIKAFKKLVKKGEIENEPYIMIMMDKNGTRLKRPYKEEINKFYLETLSKSHFQIPIIFDYKVNELFTEDKGAGLEGLISVIYPDLMIHSKKIKKLNIDFFGAGSWMMPNEKYQKIFLRFLKSLDYSIRCFEEEGKELNKKLIKEIDILREDLKKIFNKNNVGELDYAIEFLRKSQAKKRKKERYFFDKGYETRSHVVHVTLSKSSTQKFFEDYLVKKEKLK